MQEYAFIITLQWPDAEGNGFSTGTCYGTFTPNGPHSFLDAYLYAVRSGKQFYKLPDGKSTSTMFFDCRPAKIGATLPE